jgi:glycosyltransferase involved in cell wall biosynthesis
MRVLFLHQNFPGQFRHLAPALAAAGHEVVALRLEKGDAFTWQGVRVLRYEVKADTRSVPPLVGDFAAKVVRAEAVWQVLRGLKAEGFTPDAVVAHPGWGESLFVKDVWPGAPLGIYCEFYYNRSDLGFDPEFLKDETEDAPRQRLKNINNALHFDVADAGISPTRWQAATFPEPFRSDRISVIHDGIDTQLVRPDPAAFIRINADLVMRPGDEVVTFVNRNLEPYRGFHVFMRALPDLLARRPKARVVIVGGDGASYGPPPAKGTWRQIYTDEVRDRAPADAWRRVHFVGRIPYDTYLAMMRVSAVHVYHTYPFVLSWSLMEAMATECAIVASDTGPVTEMIEDNVTGRLVPFFDRKALVDRICGLLDAPADRRRLGAAARQRIVGGYDLSTITLPAQQDWVARLARG